MLQIRKMREDDEITMEDCKAYMAGSFLRPSLPLASEFNFIKDPKYGPGLLFAALRKREGGFEDVRIHYNNTNKEFIFTWDSMKDAFSVSIASKSLSEKLGEKTDGPLHLVEPFSHVSRAPLSGSCMTALVTYAFLVLGYATEESASRRGFLTDLYQACLCIKEEEAEKAKESGPFNDYTAPEVRKAKQDNDEHQTLLETFEAYKLCCSKFFRVSIFDSEDLMDRRTPGIEAGVEEIAYWKKKYEEAVKR